jgi:exodeoxyribonuclease V alpha subunit
MTPRGTISSPVAVPAPVSVLAPYVEAGIFGPFEVQLAATMARLVPSASAEELLAVAIAARAPRFGHVCAELDRLPSAMAGDGNRVGVADLPWPAREDWVGALTRSPLVSTPGATHHRVRPLVWDGSRLYLQRYWRDENAVATDLSRRARPARRGRRASPDTLSQFVVEKALDGLFGPDDGAEPDLQRLAARRALTPGISIIAGGPGTGKTRTVARLLALAHLAAAAEGESLVVALAAPTGKAAQRMTEALRAEVPLLEQSGTISASLGRTLTATDATTIHRLLQWRPGPRYLRDRGNPLPHQLVIVDETSMVSLPLMARLLDAVRTGARLVLVGDPYQLASIEAGTVLADVVGPVGDEGDVHRDDHAEESADRSNDRRGVAVADPSSRPSGGPGPTSARGRPVLSGRVTVLRRMHRFGADSSIALLAEAVRSGDADGAIAHLRSGRSDIAWVDASDHDGLRRLRHVIASAGVDVARSALRGDADAALAAAAEVKVLAATRRGPLGLDDWTARIEADVASRVPELDRHHRWYVGRPVIVTGNDRVNQVANGDVAVVVRRQGAMVAALAGHEGLRYLSPSRLDRVETWWAMTIHRSQGSEYPHAVVSLPAATSPILTRELLYTAVTRGRRQLTVVGTEEALRVAIGRRVARASGLRPRLWPQ